MSNKYIIVEAFESADGISIQWFEGKDEAYAKECVEKFSAEAKEKGLKYKIVAFEIKAAPSFGRIA